MSPLLDTLSSRLHIHFQNEALLNLATSHPSYLNETGRNTSIRDYELISVFGQELFHLILSEFVFMNVRGDVGQLSSFMSAIKTNLIVDTIVSRHGLREHYFTGKGQNLDDVKSEIILYPILAVIYLEGSYQAAVSFVEEELHNIMQYTIQNPISDWKTALQIMAQKHKVAVNYDTSTSGPSHEALFHCVVTVGGNASEGEGTTKKSAEKEAAKKFFLQHVQQVDWKKYNKSKPIDIAEYELPKLFISKFRHEQLMPIRLRVPAHPILLHQSLTHVSYLNEHRHLLPLHYGPLAFLGSYVQLFFFTLWEYENIQKVPSLRNNFIQVRSELMKEGRNAELYDELEVGKYALLGKGQAMLGVATSIKADFAQALVGSHFLTNRQNKHQNPLGNLNELLADHALKVASVFEDAAFDAKSELQSLVQYMSELKLTYTYESTGKAHETIYDAKAILIINDNHFEWAGQSSTLKEATQRAAGAALANLKEVFKIQQSELSIEQQRLRPLVQTFYRRLIEMNIPPNRRKTNNLFELPIMEAIQKDHWARARRETMRLVSFLLELDGIPIHKLQNALLMQTPNFSLKYSNLFRLSDYLEQLIAWLNEVTPSTQQLTIEPFLSGIVDTLQIFRTIEEERFQLIDLSIVLNDFWRVLPRKVKVSINIGESVGGVFSQAPFLNWMLFGIISKLKECRKEIVDTLNLHFEVKRMDETMTRLELQFDPDSVVQRVYNEIEGYLDLASLSFMEMISVPGIVRIDFLNESFEEIGSSHACQVTAGIFREVHQAQLQAVNQLGPLGGIIHDLKNALSAMRRLLKENPEGTEDYNINFIALRDQLIGRAKSLSSLFIRQRPRYQYINLIDLAHDVSRQIKGLASGNCNVKFSVRIFSDEIISDSSMIYSIIMNLAKNAIESITHDKGLIRVELIYEEDDYLNIRISDNGRGIPAEKLTSLYNSFYTTKANGNGVGLPVVKRMVDLLNGIIEVTSNLGEGTEFTVLIPTTSEV